MKKTTFSSAKLILILAAIFAPLILASCLYSAVYNLDEDDLAWLPPYEQGGSISCNYMVERRKENETLVQTRFHRATYNRQKTNIRLHRAICNGRDYDDLFAIDKSNTSAYKPEYTLIFDRIIWSKSAGLVQYTIDGEKYELQREL